VDRGYTVERLLGGVGVTNEIQSVVDSGCTNHTSGNRNAFVKETYVSLSANQCQMKTAAGELVSATSIGTVQTYTWMPGGGRQPLFLTGVLHVPGATEAGLISVSKLTKKGVKIAFTDDAAEFYQDGILIDIAKKWNKLYKLIQSGKYLDFSLLLSKKDDTTTALWHHRLGHLHLPAVLKMSNTEVVSGMPCLQANNVENSCTACLTGQMTRIPFRASTRRTKAPLELVHSDPCGPMQTQSLGGGRYFILFIDDFTKYTSIYFLKSKNEAAGYFQNYNAAV